MIAKFKKRLLQYAVAIQEADWKSFLIRFSIILVIFLVIAKLLGIETIRVIPIL